MNKIIVDGYNVIFTVPALHSLVEKSLEHSRDQLLRLVRSYLVRRRVHVTVVFDGAHAIDAPDPNSGARLTVLFSRSPFKADPMIKKLILREGHNNAIEVVTHDNDILQFARAHGAGTLTPEAFFDRISVPPEARQLSKKHNPKIDEAELDDWLRLFGEGEDA